MQSQQQPELEEQIGSQHHSQNLGLSQHSQHDIASFHSLGQQQNEDDDKYSDMDEGNDI